VEGRGGSVHLLIPLNRDVELLVADPAFAVRRRGECCTNLRITMGLNRSGIVGFRLSVRDVPNDFRRRSGPGFAQRVAAGAERLDAVVIGQAAARRRDSVPRGQDGMIRSCQPKLPGQTRPVSIVQNFGYLQISNYGLPANIQR
jgi:hypothetical protein